MRFERISNDKIKVNISNQDLQDNNIDSKKIMSNSDESQNLFLLVLEKAEEDIGFSTQNYSLKVETIALADGTFILTITRSKSNNNKEDEEEKENKSPKINADFQIYKFSDFDSFIDFVAFISKYKEIYSEEFSFNSSLYQYIDDYYLILNNVEEKNFKNLYSLVTEFSTYIESSTIFITKLQEYGKLIFKNHAINGTRNYFLKT